MNSCRKCAFCGIDGEGWELPQYDYYICAKVPARAYLTSFPYQNTKCKHYIERPDGKEVRQAGRLEFEAIPLGLKK